MCKGVVAKQDQPRGSQQHHLPCVPRQLVKFSKVSVHSKLLYEWIVSADDFWQRVCIGRGAAAAESGAQEHGRKTRGRPKGQSAGIHITDVCVRVHASIHYDMNTSQTGEEADSAAQIQM
jgi:hypothetical protein